MSPVPDAAPSPASDAPPSLPLWARVVDALSLVIGLIAHTCVEATVRFAAELGYDVTVVKDAVADYSDEMMHAALEINLPSYASAIVTTNEIIEALSSKYAAVFDPAGVD